MLNQKLQIKYLLLFEEGQRTISWLAIVNVSSEIAEQPGALKWE